MINFLNRYLAAHNFDIHLNEMAKGKNIYTTFGWIYDIHTCMKWQKERHSLWLFPVTLDIGKWGLFPCKRSLQKDEKVSAMLRFWEMLGNRELLAGYLQYPFGIHISLKFNGIFTAMNMKQGKSNDIVILVIVQVWGSKVYMQCSIRDHVHDNNPTPTNHLENSPHPRSKSTKHTAMQPSTFKIKEAWQISIRNWSMAQKFIVENDGTWVWSSAMTWWMST